MGRPVDLNTTLANIANIARINSIQHQKDETQQRLFALELKEESLRKETQTQTQQKVEPTIAQLRTEKDGEKGGKKRKKKENDKGLQLDNEQYDDEEHHIDLKV